MACEIFMKSSEEFPFLLFYGYFFHQRGDISFYRYTWDYKHAVLWLLCFMLVKKKINWEESVAVFGEGSYECNMTSSTAAPDIAEMPGRFSNPSVLGMLRNLEKK